MVHEGCDHIFFIRVSRSGQVYWRNLGALFGRSWLIPTVLWRGRGRSVCDIFAEDGRDCFARRGGGVAGALAERKSLLVSWRWYRRGQESCRLMHQMEFLIVFSTRRPRGLAEADSPSRAATRLSLCEGCG